MIKQAPKTGSGQFDLDLAGGEAMSGWRLETLQLYNWGTFSGLWTLPFYGHNALLTGPQGSGKSTIADAITTLLVPHAANAFNKAAGASTGERTFSSYVLGAYKKERDEAIGKGKVRYLREPGNYSVVLAQFRNAGYQKDATVAVFFRLGKENRVERFYLACSRLTGLDELVDHRADNWGDMLRLIRKQPLTEVFKDFPEYSRYIMRLFGIGNVQALRLFSKSISLKQIEDLDLFIRQNMLEDGEATRQVDTLLDSFTELSRAHAACVEARDKVLLLTPLVAARNDLDKVAAELARLDAVRRAVSVYIDRLRITLLETKRGENDRLLERTLERLRQAKELVDGIEKKVAALYAEISQNGGDRLLQLDNQISLAEESRDIRLREFERYRACVKELGLEAAKASDTFLRNRVRASELKNGLALSDGELETSTVNIRIREQELKKKDDQRRAEIKNLEGQKGNIEKRLVDLRSAMAEEIGVSENQLPFAGELIAVRSDAAAWEGALERVLNSFAQSLLVTPEHYDAVARFVNQNNLKGKLVYFKAEAGKKADAAFPADSVGSKLEFRPNSPLLGWLGHHVAGSFTHVCTDTIEQFQRERDALTKAGQFKKGGTRHEKNDRYAIGDRLRYVLGWCNEAKIAALRADLKRLESEFSQLDKETGLVAKQKAANKKLAWALAQLDGFNEFSAIDYSTKVEEIETCKQEKKTIEGSSNILATLRKLLEDSIAKLAPAREEVDRYNQDVGRAKGALEDIAQQLPDLQLSVATVSAQDWERLDPELDALAVEAPGGTLHLQNLGALQKHMSGIIDKRIGKQNERLKNCTGAIIGMMRDYLEKLPEERSQLGSTLQDLPDYQKRLDEILRDGLPSIEDRFRKLLNQNTIHGMALFNSKLHSDERAITERIDTINRSLRTTEYNKGRYIALVPEKCGNDQIAAFRRALEDCLSEAAAPDEQYTEERFEKVRDLIDGYLRIPETVDAVVDVRNWYVFSASERWMQDEAEFEFWDSSSGKSGGQKEKLAYTILAAALAYQFGLEWGETNSKSFRFVAIDEAFGKGDDEAARYGLELFRKLNMQLLLMTPLQKIHVIEDYISTVHVTSNPNGDKSTVLTVPIEIYKADIACARQKSELLAHSALAGVNAPAADSATRAGVTSAQALDAP